MKRTFIALTFLAPCMLFADVFNGHIRDREPEMVVQNGQYSGPIVEMIETAIERIGSDIVWSEVPWARSIESARSGQVDLLPRHSMDEERREYLLPIVYGFEQRSVYFFVHNDFPGIRQFEQLEFMSVGVLRGSSYCPQFDDANNVDKRPVNYNEQLARMVQAKRISVAAMSEGQGDLSVFTDNPAIKQSEFKVTCLVGRYISIPKDSPMAKYHRQLNDVILDMRKSGELEGIFNKYSLHMPMQNFDHPDNSF